MSQATENISFAIHPAVIRQLIEDQAGTLSKAILEGVMNGVDAMAGRAGTDRPRIDIELAFDHVVIRDNGRGFSSREEILDVFRVFGLPQTEQKTYGRFRIGRGQLFAQGRTTYTSGAYRMYVDYRKFSPEDELGFSLDSDGDYGDGVTVRVDFYDDRVPPLSEQQRVNREIKDAVRYIDKADVYLNGEKLNLNPADVGWTMEDDVAYYKFSSQSSFRGIQLYNNGVYVEGFSAYEWGISGVIVSKKALTVNQARNQIKRSSPEWRHIEEVCRTYSGQVTRKKKMLADHEAEAILKELAIHPKPDPKAWGLPGYQEECRAHQKAWADIESLQLWPDVTGQRWSALQLSKMFGRKSKLKPMDNECYAITFASDEDTEALSAHQSKLAFVFDRKLLSIFDCDPDEFFTGPLKWVLSYASIRRIQVVKLEDLASQMNRDFELLDTRTLSNRNQFLLDVLQKFSNDLAYRISIYHGGNGFAYGRTIRIGRGDADYWTDGQSYIAINEERIRRDLSTLKYGNLERLAYEIVWQSCYVQLNVADSRASTEQREKFHDLIRQHSFGALLWRIYVRNVQKPGMRAPAEVLKKTQEAHAVAMLSDAYFWWKDGDEPVLNTSEDSEVVEPNE